jgi:predicted ABC-type transport system involved in lysophospholipase L1 biosynthesis ATPase subunit
VVKPGTADPHRGAPDEHQGRALFGNRELAVETLSSRPAGAPAAICTADLKKSYGQGEAIVHALAGVTLSVENGERVALLGKSGSGKSTLLNLLGGLDHPTSGVLEVAGLSLGALSRRELAEYRRLRVGMIFQSFNLIPSRTALENVELPMIFAGVSRSERRINAKRSLEAVGLAGRLDHLPAQLSGGENQRVAVARALVGLPKILLADEPTGNLDSATAHEVMQLMIDHIASHGTTLIMVTHDEELAKAYTDRVIRLKDGCLAT